MDQCKQTVSVIIPVFNRAGVIARTLASLQNQTCPVDEIIIADDGSSDGVEPAIADYKHKSGDCRIRFLPYAHNTGAEAARWRGLLAATGTWACFLHAGDEWLPDSLERRLSFAVETGLRVVYSDGLIDLGQPPHRPYGAIPLQGAIAKTLLIHAAGINFQSLLVARSVLMSVPRVEKIFFGCQGWDLSIALARNNVIGFLAGPTFIHYPQNSCTDVVANKIKVDGYVQVVGRHAVEIAATVGDRYLGLHYLRAANQYTEVAATDSAAICHARASKLLERPGVLTERPPWRRPIFGPLGGTEVWLHSSLPTNLDDIFGEGMPSRFDTHERVSLGACRALRSQGGEFVVEDRPVAPCDDADLGALLAQMELNPFTIDPETANLLWSTIKNRGRHVIAEFGSGISTVILARALEIYGNFDTAPLILSFEQSEPYAARTRTMLADQGLGHMAQVIVAPLKPLTIGGVYSACVSLEEEHSRLSALLAGRKIDMVFIDGPTGFLANRYASLPQLADYLAEGADIFLDDALRDTELLAALLWDHLGLIAAPQIIPTPRGTLVAQVRILEGQKSLELLRGGSPHTKSG